MPQKGKKGKKSKQGKGDEELTEEEKAVLYSTPDRKGQKAKSEGVSDIVYVVLKLLQVVG